MAKYQTAQRSRHKAERVGCEREQRTHRRIEGRKEQLVENQRGGRSAEKKVYHSISVPIRLASATFTCDGCFASS